MRKFRQYIPPPRLTAAERSAMRRATRDPDGPPEGWVTFAAAHGCVNSEDARRLWASINRPPAPPAEQLALEAAEIGAGMDAGDPHDGLA